MKNRIKILILSLAAGFALETGAQTAPPVYLDPSAPIDDRVEDALSRMTTREKINIIHAQSKFCSAGVPRLGIPELWTCDGPHGIRAEVLWDEWEQAGWTNDSCVAFPALTCLAASWNPELATLYGRSLGEEARFRGKDVVLGPGVNIYRTPLNGRNFEYMGEDPHLAGKMAAAYIRGLQSNGVAACVKHFALNNHEVNRHTTQVHVDDRALYEIYLPAFKTAIDEGGAWSIMGAYNIYDNEHLCHNNRFLNRILKDEWGFKGAVLSDWGGTHNTDQAITNGLDLEFGTWTNGLYAGASNAYDNYYMAAPYLEKIASGEVGTTELDDKTRRVLRLIFNTSMNNAGGFGSLCSDEHYAAARRIGNEGIVLLANRNATLPMTNLQGRKVLVVGENAIKMMTVGGGSSSLKAQREILPLDGIRNALAGIAEVDFERGYVGDVTGEYNGVTTGQDLSESRSAQQLIADAVAKARRADYVIFVGGLNKSSGQDAEDNDRPGLELPYGQDAVIEALADATDHLIVVNVSGNAVAMPWADKAEAIVQAWYLGSESGNSIADVLLGVANPSGKLPFTFPKTLADVGAHAMGDYPGTVRPGTEIIDCHYNEGILVGYRWHDTRNIAPLFSFGHGLSYTTFEYGDLVADSSTLASDGTITFSIPVTNTGSVAGAETVQLYVSEQSPTVLRPAKELKGFAKVDLQPGQTKTVTFSIAPRDLAYFNADAHRWQANAGTYSAHAAASAADVRSTVNFVYNGDANSDTASNR